MILESPVLYCIIRRCFSQAKPKWPKIKMAQEILPPCRENPVIMTLDTPEFHSIFTEELSVLAKLFKKRNFELRVAGGAVRDILMGKQPTDLDFATDATPTQMKDMFQEEEVRMINESGEKHGTITPRINDKENFEVTTLRIDIATDGRHADVMYTTDWKLDALRRDLTINSMFMDLEGRVYDYFFGYDDLKQRKVAFVGNPVTRIREDYLRIFRYFRFYGRIVEQPDTHEEATIKAIKDNVTGLERISGERIWREWAKILTGRHAGNLVKKMLECGMGKYMGLPENPNLENLQFVYENSLKQQVPLKPMTFVAALLHSEIDVLKLQVRLKISNNERDLGTFIVKNREEKISQEPLKPYKRILAHWKGKPGDGRVFVLELLRSKGLSGLAEDFEKFELPKFPLNGSMLKDQVPPKKMQIVLRELKDIWVDGNFKISGEELLRKISQILSELEDKRPN